MLLDAVGLWRRMLAMCDAAAAAADGLSGAIDQGVSDSV
jgi:hypothetical protein